MGGQVVAPVTSPSSPLITPTLYGQPLAPCYPEELLDALSPASWSSRGKKLREARHAELGESGRLALARRFVAPRVAALKANPGPLVRSTGEIITFDERVFWHVERAARDVYMDADERARVEATLLEETIAQLAPSAPR